jgi:fatty acid desaturase
LLAQLLKYWAAMPEIRISTGVEVLWQGQRGSPGTLVSAQDERQNRVQGVSGTGEIHLSRLRLSNQERRLNSFDRMTNTSLQSVAEFPVLEARRIAHDLMGHNATIYFIDFVLSALVSYGAAAVYLTAADWSLSQAVAGLIASLALFRAGAFLHEIVHMPKGRMAPFKVAWNLLYGIPLLSPSFMYANHTDHHARRHYGTAQDGEYQPFAHGGGWRVPLYFAQVLIIPIFGVVRFLILAPLAWIHPRLRQWVWRAASSYISNPLYQRQVPVGETHGWWVACEIACFAWAAFIVILLVAGYLPLDILPKLYLLSVAAIFWNWLRNLAAHLFLSDGDPMTHEAQFQESVTITGAPWLHELLFPVGLRFHAIHHLLPGLPYHNLPEAHRRFLAQLPESAGYRRTLYRSILQVFAVLRRHMRAAREQRDLACSEPASSMALGPSGSGGRE